MATLEDSQIRFRSVVALVAGMVAVSSAVIGGVWKLSNVMSDMTTQVRELRESLDDVKSNSFTLTRASEQALRTAIENPSLRVPDPRDPNKLIIVYSAHTDAH